MEPNVWFVTPAYERFALSDICLDQRARMLRALPFEAHAVVIADDQNLDIAKGYGLDVVECDNKFVGRKFNKGYQYAKAHGATHVMPVGSDSFLSPEAFEGVNFGYDAIGLIGLSSFGPYGDERLDLGIKYPAGFGVGMVYPTQGTPHEMCSDTGQYGLDNSTWNRCGRGRLRVDFQEHRFYTYCNFHSDDVQITDYASLAKAFNRVIHHERDPDLALSVLRGHYDGDLIDRLQAIYAVRSVGAFLGQRSTARSTKPGRPARNARPMDLRQKLEGRARQAQLAKEERRRLARSRIFVTPVELQKSQRGEGAFDIRGEPFDHRQGNYRLVHSRKTP